MSDAALISESVVPTKTMVWTRREKGAAFVAILCLVAAAYFAQKRDYPPGAVVDLQGQVTNVMPNARKWNVPINFEPDKCEMRFIILDAYDRREVIQGQPSSILLAHQSEYDTDRNGVSFIVSKGEDVAAIARLSFAELSKLKSIYVKSPCHTGPRKRDDPFGNASVIFVFDPPIERFLNTEENR